MKFEKNDKVRVINTEDIWEGKVGLVFEEQEDEVITQDGRDLTQVDVLISIDTPEGEKQVMKNFNRENLEAVKEESLNETSINEEVEDQKEDRVYPQFESGKEFKEFFIGRSGIFKGFDYEYLYSVEEKEDGTFDYRDEDKEEIAMYGALEGKECSITECALVDFEPWTFTEILFQSSRWDIKFKDGSELQAIPGSAIDLYPITATESLHEGLDDVLILRRHADKKDKEGDIIAPFVYRDYGDEKPVPTWTFIGPIMNYYGMTEEDVFNFCKEYGYKVWCIRGAVMSPKLIAAAKEIDCKDIEADYIDYADGYRSATVEEIKL